LIDSERHGWGVRLLVFQSSVAKSFGRDRTGGLDDAAYSLGLSVDLDSDERRQPAGGVVDEDEEEDDGGELAGLEQQMHEGAARTANRRYIPTIAGAATRLDSVLPPTVTIDTGGGACGVWLFHEPYELDSDDARRDLKAAGRGLNERVRRNVDPWSFDSPGAASAWIRIPGSVRSKYDGHALRQGISQVSVQAAAGWNSGAMVTRYTSAVAGELSMSEFSDRW
jgi:hypothetical protein